VFLAVLTAFVIVSYPLLQTDYTQQSAEALIHLSRQMHAPADAQLEPFTPTDDTAPLYIVVLNAVSACRFVLCIRLLMLP
jgi:hypothetical protein